MLSPDEKGYCIEGIWTPLGCLIHQDQQTCSGYWISSNTFATADKCNSITICMDTEIPSFLVETFPTPGPTIPYGCHSCVTHTAYTWKKVCFAFDSSI